MINRALLLALLLIAPGSLAVSFTEDFEDDTANQDPTSTFYTYREATDFGFVTDVAPILEGSQSMKFEGSGSGVFELAGPSQLSEINFTVQGITIDDDGVGSRQVISIGSRAPDRTMVEFYIFCDDASEATGCELRVRFENVDSEGQVLIAASAGDATFVIHLVPDWTDGTYNLTVDGVNDGIFPFLELPENVGKLTVGKAPGSLGANMVFDAWFIDGSSGITVSEEGDIGVGLKQWANDVHFTSEASLFMLGLVVLAIITLAVAIPLLALGLDNTVIPAISFFASLAVLWLILMGWWPQWVGIAMIILVAALISLVVRRLLMGIRDASTNAGIVAGSLGYFIIATSLLGFSGYATESIEIPTSSLETPEDVDAQTNMSQPQQSWAGAITECAITFFSDCTRDTVSQTWAVLTDITATIFNFARTAFTFLFQLLTFSLPIPVIFNAILVLPPAAALATVGFSFITRSGS